jgi:Tol biopolymer transport system component/DNA-binding winged helix-turn-helix (wHTH) protein
MGPQPNPPPRTIFGPFEYDGAAGELRKHGTRLKLTGQPLRILEVLLEHPGEAISREELKQRLWRGTTFVDFENGLNAATSKLRQTLGDSAEQPRYIETVPSRGYRFIAAVRRTSSRPVVEMVPQTSSEPTDRTPPSISVAAEPSPRADSRALKLSPMQLAAAAIGLVLLIAGFLAAIRFARARPPVPAQTIRFRIPVPNNIKLSGSQSFSLSPDGRSLVYFARGNDGPLSLWLHSLDSLEPRMLPATESNSDAPVIWAPNSKSLAFYANEQLLRVDLNGNPPQRIGPMPSIVLGGSWSQNGTIVFGTETHGLMRVDARGGDPIPVTTRDPARRELVNAWPTFLPDGRHFLYSRLSSNPANTGVFVGSLDAKPGAQSLNRLIATPFASQFVRSTDGSGVLLFQRETTLWAQGLDTSRLELTGEPRRVGDNVGNTRAFGFYAGSASGSVLVHRNGSGQAGRLMWFDRGGKSLGPVGRQLDVWDASPFLSPDGTHIAMSKFEGDNVDVWVHDIARDVSQRITFDPALDVSPIWSPDGKTIAFSSGRAGHYDLYKVGAEGGREELLYSSNENKFANSWSSDGRFLIYSVQAGQQTIWSLPMEGSGVHLPVRLTKGPANKKDAALSPDSRWIAYVSDASGTPEIYIQALTRPQDSEAMEGGGETLISRGGGTAPHWRADGKELFYRAPDGVLTSVTISATTRVQPGVLKNLFHLAGPRWDVTPDGNQFLIGVPVEQPVPPFTVVVNWQEAGK